MPPRNVYDFGAVCDGVANDAPAFQAAWESSRDAKGVGVYVPGDRPLSLGGGQTHARIGNFINISGYPGAYQRCSFFGDGSASEIRIDCPPTVDAFWINKFEGLRIHDLCFVGDPAGPPPGNNTIDCKNVFFFFQNLDAEIENCTFAGLRAAQHIIQAKDSFRIRESRLHGCLGDIATVRWFDFSEARAEQVWMHDSGDVGGNFYQKSGGACAILIEDPAVIYGNTQARPIFLDDVMLDEATGREYLIRLRSSGQRFDHVVIRDATLNRPAAGTAPRTSISIQNAEKVDIERGWNQFPIGGDGVLTTALEFLDAGVVHVRKHHAHTSPLGAGRITADAATRVLYLEECKYSVLESAAQKTYGVTDGTEWVL